ncbi:hypothetical protein [Paracoccus marcusii]|uniref:hypothetical protein n=1 Tax=Paracoccus marcusii TaxID=59779 RepID=UPI0024939099|nr:hypothetical protein [Paracoccus marcusii]
MTNMRRTLRDRASSVALLLILLVLIGTALSGCAPVPHVECNADRTFCTSSIREYTPGWGQ